LRNRDVITIENLDIHQVVEKMRQGGKSKDVHFLNSYNIGLAIIDKNYGGLISKSGINLVDGLILLRTLRLWKAQAKLTQIRGVDFLRAVLIQDPSSVQFFKRHYFYGSTPEVSYALQEKISNLYPNVEGVFLSPPFIEVQDMNFDSIANEIISCYPDIVWIGLGTPKQDYVAFELSKRLSVPVLAVGAAFDFLAGIKIESSVELQRMGFEWFRRLVSEPKRLWRRYILVSPLTFIFPLFIKIELKFFRSK
jgi:N-acetylglucosaminyldiphosphoundecaprenol N-acetyl-beta-D-mannosaminyltransferase